MRGGQLAWLRSLGVGVMLVILAHFLPFMALAQEAVTVWLDPVGAWARRAPAAPQL